jgi:hypothetical protein
MDGKEDGSIHKNLEISRVCSHGWMNASNDSDMGRGDDVDVDDVDDDVDVDDVDDDVADVDDDDDDDDDADADDVMMMMMMMMMMMLMLMLMMLMLMMMLMGGAMREMVLDLYLIQELIHKLMNNVKTRIHIHIRNFMNNAHSIHTRINEIFISM